MAGNKKYNLRSENTFKPVKTEIGNTFDFMNTISKEKSLRLNAMLKKNKKSLFMEHGAASVMARETDLLKQYNRKLIDIGYGISRRELKQKDTVDMRPISIPTENKARIPEIDSVYKSKHEAYQNNCKNMFYTIVPCLTEGVFHINTDRYLHWKLKEIKPHENQMCLYIMDYTAIDGYWQPGVSGVIDVTIDHEKDEASIIVNKDERYLFSKIYRLIPYKELGWSEYDISIWEKIIIRYAESTEAKMLENGTDNLLALFKIYTRCASLLNFILSENKPKAVRKPKANTKSTTVIYDDKAPQPKKITRTVGLISVASEKIPREATGKTVIKYKVASWKARGGVRRLKSGKLVPFKESIRHRKCLTQTDEVPQTVIKIKHQKKE